MGNVKLKPCPFCGNRKAPTIMDQNQALWADPDYDGDLSIVVCCATRKFGCGASTGFCDTSEQAVQAWNRRIAANPSEINANAPKTKEELEFDKHKAEIKKQLADDLKRF